MTEVKSQAIVLFASDSKDADKMLTMFSLSDGLIYANIKGVKKAKAKLKAFAQPFCFAEYVFNKTGEYYSVINASMIDSFYSLSQNFDKYILGSAMLEICKTVIKPKHPSPEIFVLLLKALKQLEYSNSNSMAVTIKFIFEGLNYLGYKQQLDKCSCCGSDKLIGYGYGYSLANSGIICKKCQTAGNFVTLSAAEQAVIKNISITPIDNMQNLHFSSRDSLASVLSLAALIFKHQTGEDITTIKQYI